MCVYSHALVNRVFTNDPGDWGSIPGQIIPKLKDVLKPHRTTSVVTLKNCQVIKCWVINNSWINEI